MKCRWIKLTNYVGIKNGMDLDEIEIDFSKGKNKMIVILGDNGSGKTSLFNAINMLPDSYNDIVPGKTGKKEGIWEDGDIAYHVSITYSIVGNPINNKRETKAYIKKMSSLGQSQEMNPNGNVTSYKEYIFTEFSLDANFTALSQLSSEKRGIVDKSPAERKRYISAILSTLEVYNNIHKTITKRSSTFKGIMNSITSKLDNIGDIERLKMSINATEARINKLESDKHNAESALSESNATIKILDPDGTIQSKYVSIAEAVGALDRQNSLNEEKIKSLLESLKLNESDDIEKRYNDLKSLITNVENNIYITEAEISKDLISREEEAQSIQLKSDKLVMMNGGNIDELRNAIAASEEKIRGYLEIYSKLNISEDSLLTKDEYITGLNTLKTIKDSIDAFKGSTNHFALMEALQWYIDKRYPNTDCVEDTIDFLEGRIRELEAKYQEFVLIKKVASKLSERPSKCKIDECPFIKDAIEASASHPDENLIEIQKELDDCQATLRSNKEELSRLYSIIECINFIRSIERYILNYGGILKKLPNGYKFINRDELVQRVSYGDSFKEIDELYQYIQYANIIELYQNEKTILAELKNKYNNLQNKNDIIDELVSDLNKLNKKLDQLNNRIQDSQKSLEEDKKNLMAYKDTLSRYDLLMTYLHTRYDIKQSRNNYIAEFDKIKANIQKIKDSVNSLNIIQSDIGKIDNELNPLKKDLDRLKYNMQMYIEYTKELETYKIKFDKIETIKRYSSPSQEGIQLLFIEMYMGQTIQLANQMLSKLFNGNLSLYQYIINENEFRIPCIGENLPIDDISSLSTSQKCMVSMIISFALLKQASPKYNITKLDEIDGGLDTYNRRNFIPTLEYMNDIMDVEQCIIISHNSEIDYSKCDIIILKHNSIDIPSYGNVIYQY